MRQFHNAAESLIISFSLIFLWVSLNFFSLKCFDRTTVFGHIFQVTISLFLKEYLQKLNAGFFFSLYVTAFLFKQDSHSIQFTYLKSTVHQFYYIHKVVQPSPQLILGYFPHLERKPYIHSLMSLLSSHHSCPQATNLLPVCMDMPILENSYKCSHTIFGLL